jgi:hypothetical protein
VVLAMLVSMAACNKQAPSAHAVLQDERQRGELMDSISNDQALMTEMMGHMMQSEHALQQMEGNQAMMGKMMGNHQMMMAMMAKDTAMAGRMMEDMMAMMEKDSANCSMMCSKMMGNQHMMGMMQQMGNSGEMGKMMGSKGKEHPCPMHGEKKN